MGVQIPPPTPDQKNCHPRRGSESAGMGSELTRGTGGSDRRIRPVQIAARVLPAWLSNPKTSNREAAASNNSRSPPRNPRARFALERCSLLILTEQGTGCRTHEQASGTPDAGCRQVFLDGGAQAGDERSDRLVLSQQLQELDLQSHGMKAVMREEPPAELVVDLDHPTGFRKTTAHGEQRGH